MSSKSFSCLFKSDVLCSHVHNTRFGVIYRCLACKFYLEFAREQEDFEDEAFEEHDRLEREKLDG